MTKYLAQKLFDYHRERLGMIMMSGTGRVNAIVRNVNHDLLAGVKGCLVGLLSFLNSYPVEGVEADQVILSVAGSSHSGVEIWLVMGVTFLLGFVAGYVTRGWIDEDKPRRRKKTRRPSDGAWDVVGSTTSLARSLAGRGRLSPKGRSTSPRISRNSSAIGWRTAIWKVVYR